MTETWRRADGYEIATDKSRIDLAVVHGFLKMAYWSENVPREVVSRSIAGSFCFSLFDPAGAPQLAAIFAEAWPVAWKKAAIALRRDGIDLGPTPVTCLYALDEVQAGWLRGVERAAEP